MVVVEGGEMERRNTEPINLGSKNADDKKQMKAGKKMRCQSAQGCEGMPVTQRVRLDSMGSGLATWSSSRPPTPSFSSNGTPSSVGTPTRARKNSHLSWQDEDSALRKGDSSPSAGSPNQALFPTTITEIKEEKSDDSSCDDKVVHELEGPSRVSLSEPTWEAWLCCQFPGVCLFSLFGFLVVTSAYSQKSFLTVSVVLTLYVYCWTCNMSIFSAVGAWRMRRDCAKDWHALLEQAQKEGSGDTDIMHIVILPNYKEDEDMLFETLENIARSPSAAGSFRVVLGMEAREGVEGMDKAQRLIKKCKGLFVDIFATYHPPGIAGELAGKSSNSQWAYRAALKRYAKDLKGRDETKVFLSVGDADTLWNPQYFDCLAVQGLTMPAEQRQWCLWQPPMLLFRNLFAVPGVTRLAGMGTLLFELAGLANQHVGSHFCFSSYSLTLALAKHKEVRGWDTDVVAEDHHMFLKCFFAPLWEAAEDPKVISIEPKVQLRPVYLPAEGYLVESSEGYWASCYARFQQARRHCQGVAELGYALQQYVRLINAVGASRISFRTHRAILAIMWKMYTVHIVNAAQAFSLIMAFLFAGVGVFGGLWLEGFGSVWEHGGYHFAAGQFTATEFANQAFHLVFGPAPWIAMISGGTIYIAVRDVIEGRYAYNPDGAVNEKGKLSSWERFKLAIGLQRDMLAFAEPTVVCYQLVPVTMACWSLLRQGMRFEYVVAAKPGDSSKTLAEESS